NVCAVRRLLVRFSPISAALVIVLAGCGSGTARTSPTTIVTAPSPSGPTTTTVATSPGGEVVVKDPDAGHSVHVPPGGVLRVELDSTYWRFQPATDPGVLVADGDEVFTADPGPCPLGGGCGGVSQRYRAIGSGRTTVSATRANCGEAFVCPPGQTTWTIDA